jgi:5'-3' exonuclease
MTQLLTGDNADNIPGLSKLADESKIKYGIRTAGVGKVSAEKILGSCSTEKELAENTIECYMSAWPDDWKQRLNDMGFFLYLLRHENDKWDVDKYFESLGVRL